MPTVVNDELELIEAMADDLGADVIYTAGRVFRCRDNIWHDVSDKGFEYKVLQYSRVFHVHTGKQRDDGTFETKPRKISVSEAKRFAGMLHGLIEKPDTHFHTGPRGVAFGPDFVHPDGRVETLKREHLCRSRLPFAYNPDASCFSWLSFLNDIFEPDEDREKKILFMQEYIGACLFGIATEYDRLVVMHGGGSNGKSVLLNVVKALFPMSAVASVPPQRWHEEYYLATLEGKMLNVCAELPERQILASEELKAVIAGDEQTARHPRGEPFKFHPRAGHLFAANNLPRMTDFSKGLWRRLEVIAFNRTFEDTGVTREELVEGMKAELEGIAAWAAEGCARLVRQRDFTTVPSSVKLKGQWRMDSNPVEQWVADRCHPAESDDDFEKSSTLYEDFCRWAEKEGFRKMNSTTFGSRLTELGFDWVRKNYGRVRPLTLRPFVNHLPARAEPADEETQEAFWGDPV